MSVALYSTNPNIYRFRKHAKGHGLGLDGLLGKSTFRVRQISPVEAEDEFVEIIIGYLWTVLPGGCRASIASPRGYSLCMIAGLLSVASNERHRGTILP
jgi:hypothetical protein